MIARPSTAADRAQGGGFWCDVAPHPLGLAWVWTLGPIIEQARTCVVEVIDAEVLEVLRTVAPSAPRQIRLACNPRGDVCLVGQAQDGTTADGLLVYFDGAWTMKYPCYGGPSVRWDGSRFVVYTQVSATQYARVINGVMSEPVDIGRSVGGSGFSQVTSPDGLREEIRWSQDERVRLVRGLPLTVTMEVAGVVTGQFDGEIAGVPIEHGDAFLALDAPGMDPRLAYSPVTQRYGVCSWTEANQACYQESPPYRPLPATPPDPVIFPEVDPFLHPVTIAPFKDPTHASGCPVSAEELGLVTTPRDNLPDRIREATATGQRIFFYWDEPTRPVVPTGLRPWDLVGFECYRRDGETLADSVARWGDTFLSVLAQWPGDLAEIPMMYGQFNPATRTELWTVQQILDGLAYALAYPNGSSRLKVLAPFAYDRTNGITAHPELQEMLTRIVAASPGPATLTPIPSAISRHNLVFPFA